MEKKLKRLFYGKKVILKNKVSHMYVEQNQVANFMVSFLQFNKFIRNMIYSKIQFLSILSSEKR